jgi:hypothetical protein
VGYFSSLYSSELPHRARAVYMYLYDRADKGGKCYPAIGTGANRSASFYIRSRLPLAHYY